MQKGVLYRGGTTNDKTDVFRTQSRFMKDFIIKTIIMNTLEHKKKIC